MENNEEKILVKYNKQDLPQQIKYMPIMLDSLALNSILNFDLYYKIDKKQYILYRSKNLQLTEEQFEFLKKNFKTLYIRTTEQKEYIHYIEDNIDNFLTNPQISENAKAFVLYDVTQDAISEIMENPENPKTVKRIENVIKATTAVLTKKEDFFYELLEVMSFDYSTYTHSSNVATFTINFSKYLNFKDIKKIEIIGLGAFLHDIGKAKIPPQILFKQGKLTKDEWVIVQCHPELGYEIVKKIFPDNYTIQKIVRNHHEKIDGSGYPDKLKQYEIPIEVQIVTLSDVFDALTTNRCYKAKLRTYDALKIMQEEQLSGKYDKNLLEKFITMFKKI
ncbi:MAG TPA: HD domain-containing protein [bacterium]|nr:HD domain-containing protein [bacterium]HOL47634.1 HD domain-containing protein [bacterium]HPQ19654.1 HD domain-containing protein [bacterium]